MWTESVGTTTGIDCTLAPLRESYYTYGKAMNHDYHGVMDLEAVTVYMIGNGFEYGPGTSLSLPENDHLLLDVYRFYYVRNGWRHC